MTDNKYNLLVHVLDKIAKSAPKNLGIYHPEQDNTDAEIHKRSRSFIHLFLKVRFGILDFDISELQITDGTNDGGLDAYHIDEEEKKIYLIQSKFSATSENFETNPVNGYEFFRMELDRIISDGKNTLKNGNGYNGKIIDFQKKLQNIQNLNRYEYILVYLGNVSSRIDQKQLLQVSGNVCDVVEIINGETFYKDVLMPYLQHDFFNQKDFVLKIQVYKNQSNRISYSVDLGDEIRAGVELAFVPTKEIAIMMSKYRNSLLRYNPRCYVGLTRGGVNQAIQESMKDTELNEFSLLNNGITIICNDFSYSDRNAEPGVATLLVTNPQIVNGGQTAFTLAYLLKNSDNENHFENKEVLVKFITLSESKDMSEVIEKISKATNNQTPVRMADRRSNDEELVQLQDYLFNTHGFLLERKRGQFYDV
ncbi:MAG: AIPR family protein, partial [Candidatus Pacebacteria bacterium]|nr:AIPR family protein [Candidatus Paceibacterota bacterium]